MKAEGSRGILAVGCLFSLLVAICAISPGSLWVDELGTWLLTQADTASDWWKRFESWPELNSQIPLYHFYMYAWTKLFGTSVIAMRASNVGLFVIATLALIWPFRSDSRIAISLICASCLSAPLWYFVNEIRPYIMLYMGVCLMISGTVGMLGSQPRPSSFGIKVLCTGAVVSSGASVLGIAWAGAFFLFVLIYSLVIRKRPLSDIVSGNYAPLMLSALCVTAFFAHDMRMFAHGRHPVLLHESNLLTMLFSFYTNLGLLGLGPGVLDLRASGASALFPFVFEIAFGAILFVAIAIAGLWEIKSKLGSPTVLTLVACVAVPVTFTFALGLVLHWRVLPRHLIPLVPLFSLLYAFGLAQWLRRPIVGRTALVLVIVVMGYSSFSVRYAPRHAKDDYRYAAELASAELAIDGRVWWVADFRGALYYNIPYAREPIERQRAQPNREAELIGEQNFLAWSTQEPPTLVLLSRPDTYDRQNLVSNYLLANKYRLVETFPAFTAWRR